MLRFDWKNFALVVVTSQINLENFLVSFFRIDCSQQVKPKIFWKMFVVLEMDEHLLKINEYLLKMFLYNISI